MQTRNLEIKEREFTEPEKTEPQKIMTGREMRRERRSHIPKKKKLW